MNLKKHLRLLTVTVLAGTVFNSYGQQKPIYNQKHQQIYYRKTLQVDSAKAQRIAQIQDSYKAGMNLLISDTSLNDAAKRIKIKALMDSKNQQLRLLLSPAQQAKIIPVTEREQATAPKSN